MATRTAELVARLVDEVSGPARGMAGALKGVAAAGKDLGKVGAAPGLDKLNQQLKQAKDNLAAVERLKNAQSGLATAKMGLAGPIAEAQRLKQALEEARAKAAQFDGIKAFSKTSGIGKEIAETREAVRLLAKEEGAAQRAVKVATGAVEQQERTLRQARKTLNEFGVPITSIGRHEEALRGTVARTTAAIEKQTRALKDQRSVAERPAPAARRTLAPSAASSALADRVSRAGKPANRTLGPLGGIVGAYSIAQGYKDAAKFDRRLTMIGQTADASRAEIDKMGAGLFELAQQTATPIDKLTGGLESLVAQGRSLKEGLNFLPSVARTAAASGSEVEDIAKTADSVGTNFEISGKQMQSAFDIMVAGGKAGQFELKDMARYLPSLGPAASAIGFKGEKGLADLVAMLQVMRKGSGTAEEAVSSMNNILAKMESDKTTKGLKDLGVDSEAAFKKARKEGRNLVEVFEELVDTALKGDRSRLGEIIDDMEFKRGVQALMSYKGEWKKLSGTLQSSSAGSVVRDLAQVTKDSQAAVDRLSNSFEQLKTSAARAGDSLGASKGMGELGGELQLVATAMERINRAYEAGGISGAFGQAVKDAKERIRQNNVEYADRDREAQVKRIKEMEESIAETRKTMAGKGYSQERIDGAVRTKTMQLAAERRQLENMKAERDALSPPDKVPLRMGVDPTAPISGQPGAIGPGVAGFQGAFPLDLSKQPKRTRVPLPPRRPKSLHTTIGSIDEVLGPKQAEATPALDPAALEDLKSRFEIRPTIDAGSLAGAEARLHEAGKRLPTTQGAAPESLAARDVPVPPRRPVEFGGTLAPELDEAKRKADELNTTTIAPKGDGAGLAPLGTAADEAKAKLSALAGVSVAPTVNASSIAAAEAAVDSLLAKLARVGPAVAGAAAAASSGAVRTGKVSSALSGAFTSQGMG